jgi:hypothetical protein
LKEKQPQKYKSPFKKDLNQLRNPFFFFSFFE